MVWYGMVWHGTNGMVWRPQIRRYGVQRWPATALHTTKGELRKENNSSEGTKSDENLRCFVFYPNSRSQTSIYSGFDKNQSSLDSIPLLSLQDKGVDSPLKEWFKFSFLVVVTLSSHG